MEYLRALRALIRTYGSENVVYVDESGFIKEVNRWSEPSPDREFFEIFVWFIGEGLPDSRTGE